jgi:hypothetical protein
MWAAKSITLKPVELDFTSSGQGIRKDRALVADDEVIANAVDLVDFSENPLQAVVCTSCGFSGCEPGGWVALRRIGDAVVWLPDFETMAEGESAMTEHAPPRFIGTRGALILRGLPLEWVRTKLSEFPDPRFLPALSGVEAARLLQWEAPGRLLGQFPGVPRVDRSRVIAADSGDTSLRAAEVDRLLSLYTSSREAVVSTVGAEPVTFFVDLSGIQEWRPVAETRKGQLVFRLDPTLDVTLP